jgi:hypothetical protein
MFDFSENVWYREGEIVPDADLWAPTTRSRFRSETSNFLPECLEIARHLPALAPSNSKQ